MALFKRVYSLVIGSNEALVVPAGEGTVIRPDGEESSPTRLYRLGYTDYLTIPKGFIQVKDLRIKADLKGTKTGKSNKSEATIEIFNMSKDSINSIAKDDTVLLKAGYVGDEELPLVYAGQVSFVSTVKKGVDTITKLTCTAASSVRKNIRISKKPVVGENEQDVCNYLAEVAGRYGIPVGSVTANFPPYVHIGGMPIEGNLFKEMEEYCDAYGLRVYTSLGRLYIEPVSFTKFTDVVNIFEVDLKASISPQSSSVTNLSTQTKLGLTLNVFLNGRINTKHIIRITFGQFKGDYKVISLSHKLDSEGKQWDTTINCERLA